MFEREKEFVAPKAKTGAEAGIVTGSVIVVVAVVALLIWKLSMIGGISAILVVIPVYLNMSMKKEYSYSFSGDRLTVSIVDFKGKKTQLGKPVFLENLVVCASESDEAHNGALKDTYSTVIDSRTSPKSKTAAFAVFERDGAKSLVRFEPLDMMIDEMKKYADKKIFI